MADRAQQGQQLLPNLVVAQRVLDKMAGAARAWQEDETGEALIGLVEPGHYTNGVPGICLLDTIAPDESALRMAHTFQQGDQLQDELLWWLQENWRARRLRGDLTPREDVPLRYLGDWHKQPDGMTRPSHGDLRTARDWLRDPDNDMDFLLAPIVTLNDVAAGVARNRIRIDGRTCVDFWYLQRQDRDFRSIAPVVYQDRRLPRLVAAPWHLQDPRRLDDEVDRLQQRGLSLAPLVFLDLLGNCALDVCFLLGRPGAAGLFLVATPADYPAQPPQLRLTEGAALGDETQLHERFAHCWHAARPLSAPAGRAWSAERRLADLIDELERASDLRSFPADAGAAAVSHTQRSAP